MVGPPRTGDPATPLRRGAELLAVEAFVDGLAGEPGMLLIEGEAGIGKTTLWEAGLARARALGHRVATARVGRPETSLSFAALGDVCDGLEHSVLADLPQPQRDALDVALLRVPPSGTAHDLRAVALATLSMLRSLAAETPVLVALDDVQWLDKASGQVVTFVLRLLGSDRIGFLVTRRVGEDGAVDREFDRAAPDGLLTRLEIGPLPAGELSAIVREKLQRELPHSVMTRIHQVTGGNPFFALEVARQVIRVGTPAPGSPLPLPPDKAGVLRERIVALPPQTRAALEVLAAASRPTLDLLRQALPEGLHETALVDAERAGIVVVRAGRVRFAHPLFSAAVAAMASPPEWRAVHRRVADSVSDPEERARHLALSATGPDPEIASALDAAALRARRRGAAASAAELASLAREFGPDRDPVAASQRAIAAAMFSFDAGDARAAHQILEEVIEASTAGAQRAAMMNRICEISWQDTLRVEHYAKRAIADAGEGSAEAARAHASLSWVGVYRGDLDQAAVHARSAREAISDDGVDPELRYDVLTAEALTAFLAGRPHELLLAEAVAQQETVDATGATAMGPVYSSARVVRGLISLWAGDLGAARRFLEDEVATYESLGRYVARDELLCYLAELECRAGEWKKAEAYADECLEIGEESGHLLGRGQNLVPRAWVSALVGDLTAARTRAREGLRLSLDYQDLLAAAANRGVLGFADLSEGNAAGAVEHLRPMIDFLRAMRTTEPGLLPFVGDAVEALVACGEIAEAETIARDERLMGRLSRRAGAVETLRVRGLLLAARGETEAALASLQEAGDLQASAEQPFEHARTLLVRGEVERRARRHATARDDLEEATAIFDGLGAVLWAERARTASGRVTSTGTPAQELSPTERLVTALVVEGKTNREAADLLFLSVKTVEANLSRVYRKLGVRSRAELVRRLVADQRDGSPRDGGRA